MSPRSAPRSHSVLPGSALALLTVLLAACSARPAPPSEAAITAGPPLRSSTAAPTPSPVATNTPTPTAAPSPTPTPSHPAISPLTLAQLRPVWVIDEPGNPNAEAGCQDMACWTISRIGAYAFGPNGDSLAVGLCTVDSTENTTNPRHYRYNCDGPAEVRLYASATGRLLQTLAVGDFPLAFAFHPGRPLLAVGMAHRSIEIWDLEAGSKIQTLLHSTKRTGVEDLAFSNDGTLLVSDGDGLLQLWQWERGLPAGTIENASDFAFSPSGEALATLFWSERGDYAEARFYPLDDLERFRAFRLDWAKVPSRIAYLPDGSALLAMSGLELELVDPGTGEILHESRGDDLLAPGGLVGYTNLTSELTDDGQLFLTAAVQGPDGSYGEGLGLWDPRSSGAQIWLSTVEGQEFQVGEAFFYGFGVASLTAAPGDSFLLARDQFSGILWIWGVDPSAPSEGATCLGTCSG